MACRKIIQDSDDDSDAGQDISGNPPLGSREALSLSSIVNLDYSTPAQGPSTESSTGRQTHLRRITN